MKQIFQKILSVFMAFVVLFTTMSFTIDMHYCGDTLVDVSLFTKAESCGMEEAQPSKNCEIPVISEKKCCSDQQIIKEASNELISSFDQLNFEQQLFLAALVYHSLIFSQGLEENPNFYKNYSPPLVSKLIYKLDETYLI
tara:strand:- start:4451 stop:4870 length:420 start_codon:yes stop_codon:yes gene_type:complete